MSQIVGELLRGGTVTVVGGENVPQYKNISAANGTLRAIYFSSVSAVECGRVQSN